MSADRKTAMVIGALFILGFAGAVTAALTKPILDAPDYLLRISANPQLLTLGALFQFVMAAACASIGITLYPVLKRSSESLALGAAGFRIIEAVFQIAGAIILLLLLTLGRDFASASAPDRPALQAAGVLLQASSAWVNNVVSLLAWCIGALAYYYVFYRARLIPRWLSVWGIVGIALTIISCISVMFYLIDPMGMVQGGLNAPIALQEIVMAVWLITKGFDSRTLASASVKAGPVHA